MVTLAAVIPDADGMGIISDVASKDQGSGLLLYGQYHHVLAHNVFFGLLLTAVVYALSKKRGIATPLVLLSFHIQFSHSPAGRSPERPRSRWHNLDHLLSISCFEGRPIKISRCPALCGFDSRPRRHNYLNMLEMHSGYILSFYLRKKGCIAGRVCILKSLCPANEYDVFIAGAPLLVPYLKD